MEFRLTYQGRLLGASRGNTRASHKHDIRRVFHRQLKRYWNFHPYLKDAHVSHRRQGRIQPEKKLVEYLAEQNKFNSYNFVPLVTESLSLTCSVEILFLRPSVPGKALSSGDIDNRLKTLFDALRMPKNDPELGSHKVPHEDETPFYCLLEDDSLISHVSVETDTLLEPTSEDEGDNDARLVIAVRLKPFDIGWDNISFA